MGVPSKRVEANVFYGRARPNPAGNALPGVLTIRWLQPSSVRPGRTFFYSLQTWFRLAAITPPANSLRTLGVDLSIRTSAR